MYFPRHGVSRARNDTSDRDPLLPLALAAESSRRKKYFEPRNLIELFASVDVSFFCTLDIFLFFFSR